LGSAARDELGLTRDAAGRDRNVAALLSALAEAPDFTAALNFLLAQLSETAGARRAYALVLDEEGELQALGAVGFGPEEARPKRQSTADVDHPLTVSVLGILPVVGREYDARHGIAFAPWTALPLPRAHYRGAPKPLSEQQARERLAGTSTACLAAAGPRRPVSTPGAVEIGRAHV
jgi:hypothetical protein